MEETLRNNRSFQDLLKNTGVLKASKRIESVEQLMVLLEKKSKAVKSLKVKQDDYEMS